MRALIVGWGLVGQRHARNLKALVPDCDLAIWRQRLDTGAHIDRLMASDIAFDRLIYHPEKVKEWRADFAIIANPASMHVEAARYLSHMPLFIEKPIADRVSPELHELIDDANYGYGLPLMVGYDLRFYRPLITVKQAIDEVRIGRPLSIRCEVGQYLPDWRPGRDYRTSVSARKELGGGVILELSHELDYARWLMGEVTSVSAVSGKLSELAIDVEDSTDILLTFASGAHGAIHLDMVDRVPVRRLRVVGSEGSIELDLLADRAAMEAALFEEMRHFLACCRGESYPPVDGKEGRRVVEICEAVKRSAEEGRRVQV